MISLKELIKDLEVKKIIGTNGLEIEGIVYDSRKVKNNFIFVCLKGSRVDGHDFIRQAKERGAAAIVVEKVSELNGGLTQIVVAETKSALAKLASRFYNFPTQSLKVIGVTGTDGKTTTTRYVKSILEEAGQKCGLIGTISYELGERVIPADRTTPESLDLQFLFSEMLKEGCSHAVMEVSSHGLSQGRTQEIDFKLAVFTNLSHEHLDFHKTMDEYFLSKKKLFETGIEKGIVNRDDTFGEELYKFLGPKALGYGLSEKAELHASDIRADLTCTRYRARGPGIDREIALPLLGRHNIYNSLAAMGVGLHLGINPDLIKKGLERLTLVPGRFQLVKCGQPFTVIVDYAHTPRALENALTELKFLSPGKKLLVVFGCGGERDRTKRPLMGEIATRLADYAFVTSDNPRGEEPSRIIEEIVAGIGERKNKFLVEPDREKAITMAMDMAKPSDLVLLAGKGHEKYQIVGSVYLPFDDVEKAKAILSQRSFSVDGTHP